MDPEPAFSGAVQPPNLDHFLCYSLTVTGPISEQVPFGLTPASVELRDQFGRLVVQPRTPDRLCNPVNKILPSGQGFPPANINAHLVCDPIAPQTMAVRKVRLGNQFGEGRLNASPRQRLCLPTWKQDVQNPNAPGSVAVPRPAGTPVQPPGLDHFECYELKPSVTAPQFQNKPPFVVLVDQFVAAVRLCLPSFKRLVKPPPPDFDGSGTTDISVFRPSTGFWFISGGAASFGTSGDHPVAADYDGDGTTTSPCSGPRPAAGSSPAEASSPGGRRATSLSPATTTATGTARRRCFRPSTGVWFVNGGAIVAFGAGDDRPLPLPSAIRTFFFP